MTDAENDRKFPRASKITNEQFNESTAWIEQCALILDALYTSLSSNAKLVLDKEALEKLEGYRRRT